MSLIDSILTDTKARLEARKARQPLDAVRKIAADAPRGRTSLRAALRSAPFSLIAEVKPRSPSSGRMDETNVASALAIYDATPSVAAISILTDEDHFGSSLDALSNARMRTEKPLLRKDFIVDEYQVWEARARGADAVLVMSGLHAEDPPRAAALVELARHLKMDVLFELGMTGDGGLEKQRALIRDDAVIWGINSRRFNTSRVQAKSRLGVLLGKELSTNKDVHRELRSLIPAGEASVAESGIDEPGYLRDLRALNYSAALIGTAFLKKGVKVAEVVRAFDREVASLVAPTVE